VVVVVVVGVIPPSMGEVGWLVGGGGHWGSGRVLNSSDDHFAFDGGKREEKGLQLTEGQYGLGMERLY